jgi:hypothetical protein
MIPPRFFVFVRELRFGGSANFKISTLYVLCAVCSGADHGGQRVNPSTHPGVSQARKSLIFRLKLTPFAALFDYFPAVNRPINDRFARQACASPTILIHPKRVSALGYLRFPPWFVQRFGRRY